MPISPDFWLPRRARTMYFIGVTTAQSSIMQVFPRWSAVWGLDAVIEGYDAPLHAPAETYRAIVQHIKGDPLSLGALVTTHKIDLLHAARDLFDAVDPHADLCGEVSAIVKRDGKLIAYAFDPISVGLAWEAFVPAAHFHPAVSDAPTVLCFGAGGAAIALSVYLARRPNAGDRPTQFYVVDINPHRLDGLREIHAKLTTDIQFTYLLHTSAAQNDALLTRLPPGSVVVNATGMGKDTPGSPISDAAPFPILGFAWDMNYRGELTFLRQARQQQGERTLTVENGWVYFLHGWTQVISAVFDSPLSPALFAALDAEAVPFR